MNQTLVDRIVQALLYEGYILYPYRPSLKNRQRWTFGGLYPEAYCQAQGGADAASNQTECLVEAIAHAKLDVVVRFLHLTERTVGEISPTTLDCSSSAEPSYRVVEALRIGAREFHSWQEAEERKIELPGLVLSDLVKQPLRHSFTLPGTRSLEPLRGEEGDVRGVLVRDQQAIAGEVQAQAVEVAGSRFKVTVRITNHTPLPATLSFDRDAALTRALVATHVILGIHNGTFISLLDPPESWVAVAADCRNIGTWPILVGEEGDCSTMLSSPIILYDYPQVAPESSGDLFDATEIDEILTLRILTLTEEEKHAAVALDERTGEMMARTESLARDQLARLHGTLRPVPGGLR